MDNRFTYWVTQRENIIIIIDKFAQIIFGWKTSFYHSPYAHFILVMEIGSPYTTPNRVNECRRAGFFSNLICRFNWENSRTGDIGTGIRRIYSIVALNIYLNWFSFQTEWLGSKSRDTNKNTSELTPFLWLRIKFGISSTHWSSQILMEFPLSTNRHASLDTNFIFSFLGD